MLTAFPQHCSCMCSCQQHTHSHTRVMHGLLVHAITTPLHYSCYECATLLLLLPLAVVNVRCLSIHTLHAHLPYSHGLSTHSQVQPISQPLLCAQVEVCVCCSVSFDVNVRPSRFTFSLLTTSARNTHIGSCLSRLVSWLALTPLAYKLRTIFKACPIMGPLASPSLVALQASSIRSNSSNKLPTTTAAPTPPAKLVLTAQRFGGPKAKAAAG